MSRKRSAAGTFEPGSPECPKCGTTRDAHPTRVWKCFPCDRKASRDWAIRHPKRAAFQSKRLAAKARGVEFTISMEDVEWPTHCPILGVELKYRNGRGKTRRPDPASVSFDRIDPSKGYVPGNVAIISYRANVIKNSGSAEEHRAIAEWMDAQEQQ